jgi:hypothetical protein
MELYATHNGIDVYFSKFEDDKGTEFCKARKRIRGKYDICPFCQKDVKEGTIYLLFNNWKLFPNIIIHFPCCNGFPSGQAAVKYLHEDYQKALKHKHWFNKE